MQKIGLHYIQLLLAVRNEHCHKADSQEVVSSQKLNLPRDMRWVAKRTCKFPRKYTKVAKKTHFKADISCISLADNSLMGVTQLALTFVGWPNGEKLASTCVQI